MKRFAKLLTAALLSAVVSTNVIAFMQARAMTNFTGGGERSAGPEQLSLLDGLAVIVSGVNIPRPQNRRTPADLGLSFETHRFPSGNGSTLDAWYVPGKDEGVIVALFHGYAASKSTLLPAARVFHEIGVGTLLVDFYGSGESSGNDTTLGVEEARDVEATINFARRTWPNRKIVLYGASMGGAAILRAIAAEGPKPDAVILESTFDTLLHTARNRFHATGLPSTPFAELLLFWGSLQRWFNFFSHNPIVYAHAVTCPALVLHGEKDARVSIEQARGIAQAIGDKARFIAYPDVPHMPIVDARPSEWRRDMRVFLQQLR